MREYTLVRNGKHAGEFDTLDELHRISIQVRRLEALRRLPPSDLAVARSRELVSEGVGRAVQGRTPSAIVVLKFIDPDQVEPAKGAKEGNEE